MDESQNNTGNDNVIRCPICKSENIEDESLYGNNGIYGSGYREWKIKEIRSCKDCGNIFKPLKIEKPSLFKIEEYVRKRGEYVELFIEQGAPVIYTGYILEIGENVVALEFELKSKNCEVSCCFSGSDGKCGLHLIATEHSLNLNTNVSTDTPTIIEFVEFVGWNVFAYSIGRYTLHVCLTKM